MASPESPPFASTSSCTSVTQSATTFGRVPGTVRISVSVGMAGNLHHRAPAWYACRDGPVASVTSRGARGADGAEPPQLPGSVPAVRRPAGAKRVAAPFRYPRGGAADAVHRQLHAGLAAGGMAGG